MNRLPDKVVEHDHALEKTDETAALTLMQWRWHWTLDESNPHRVSIREYAKYVSRDYTTIHRCVKGYAIWNDPPGGIILSAYEAQRRAGMTAETEAAVDAVAQARGVQFTYAQNEFYDEARRIRETARERAEEKGTSTLDEIPQAASITYKRQEAERERDGRRAERQPLRFIEIEAALNSAQRDLIKAIRVSEQVELPEEYRELLAHTLDSIKRLVAIADRAIVDAYDTSWQREFHLIEGGLAS